ncbi:uncharacterized protein LOC123218036 isoform X3 [Mangifera indica]|uniref:uncharacterized protein LOC123218036 isoform X3 n=1 Tax=Mangifera indica TaxID=29780 RepID=UPI001CFA8E01|nr:uncharacterized protein LOC123218036 isoform X3 [Mangifera indica]
MSDLEVCPATGTSGIVLMENRLCTTASSFQSFPAVLNSISEQNWEIAERRTDEILCLIRPTLVSDNHRREVINYVHDLISTSLGCEVFPYGSVPLKTYLPDGDIDLTAISSPNAEETLVADVHAVLKAEELNMCSQFEVKDVHCIDAEVKLVKCLVQNIVVDISFNQLGGLCALCFLEQVDGLVGKNHLLKRSIILIKAWCYYESRILGAHHGLISTYALETLVLSIFHLFHSSLDGPLAVLYRFLDYFSKFDWENHCVSLNGPVCKSSLDVAASKVPERGVDNLLLSEEFLQECADKFSVPSRGPETNSRAFPQKHLNIIDALKENNNLGRSVNRGNFYRICSAFKYGAHKLGQILLLPQERLVNELNKFFANTLERHRNQYWADGQDFFSNDDNLSSTQCSETCIENMFLTSLTPGYSNKITRSRNDSRRDLLKVVPSAYKKKVDSSKVVPELNCTSDRNTVSGRHLAEAAGGGPIGILYSKNRNDLSSSLPLNSGIGVSLLGKSQIDNGSLPGRILSKSFQIDDMSFALCSESKENTLLTGSSFCLYGNHESIVPKYLSLSTPVSNVSANSSSPLREKKLKSILGSSESSNCLLDLSGNYESHLSSLLYGKCYYLSAAVLLCPGNSHQVQHMNLQETIWQSLPLEPEVYSKMSRNGRLGHQNHPSMPSNFVFSSELSFK